MAAGGEVVDSAEESSNGFGEGAEEVRGEVVRLWAQGIEVGWRGAAGIDHPRARGRRRGGGNEDWRRERIRMARRGRGSPARATRGHKRRERRRAVPSRRETERGERDEMVQWQFCNHTEVQIFIL